MSYGPSSFELLEPLIPTRKKEKSGPELFWNDRGKFEFRIEFGSFVRKPEEAASCFNSFMPRGKKKGGLGAALVNGQRRARQEHRDSSREAEMIASLGFESVGATKKSVTETNDLETFLSDALLAEKNFASQRGAQVIDLNARESTLSVVQPRPSISVAALSDFNTLPIPRRPRWTRDTSVEELNRLEKESFLNWRRAIAEKEEANPDVAVSPFEKNLEFWKQLWRVVERSDVVVQVLDARNPLLFRSEDLEAFVSEVGACKKNLVLLNKADLITEAEMKAWTEYFDKQKLRCVFFSAKMEQEKLSQGTRDDSSIVSSLTNRTQLLLVLEGLAREAMTKRNDVGENTKATVGMTGFPNVGKSSVINVLMGTTPTDHSKTRVSVAATPGHTKHFQTLVLSEGTVLCDCPGLVFPVFSSKATFLVSGILPIDEIRGRDFLPAVEIVCSCISRKTFEEVFSLRFPLAEGVEVMSAGMLLEEYCRSRGIHESIAAREVLKAFVSGKLLHCMPPPELDDDAEEEKEVHKDLQEALEEFDLENELEGEAIGFGKNASRRRQRHGKKHRKARDPDPYGGGNFFGVHVASKKEAKVLKKQVNKEQRKMGNSQT